MQLTKTLTTITATTCGFGLLTLISGCAGGSGGAGGAIGTEMAYGSFTTRAVGTAQNPVISASKGATIYGIAGASFTEITQNTTDPNVYIIPASNRIVFIRKGELGLMDGNGLNVTTLTSTRDNENRPVISPNGQKIVYEYNDGVNIMNVNGTGVTRFLENAFSPAYSPDGTKILFSRVAANGYRNIFVVNADGTNVVQLTNLNAGHYYPRWSPDGTKIIFEKSSQVFSMASNGSSVIQLTSGSPSGYAPTYSPNGSRIAFYGGGNTLWTMNPDGSGKVRILSDLDVNEDYSPAYSPDGQKIYFTVYTGSQYDVFWMPATGGTATNITSSSTIDDFAPFVSPITSVPPPPPAAIKRIIASTGGLFGTGCAGFLFGQLDKTATSVVTFDTATATVAGRSVSRITPLTAQETSAQNLIFTISGGDAGGNISNLRYTNGPSSVALVNVNANGAIVTFSANDGTVTTVLPYAGTKAAGQSVQATQDGDLLTVRGHFPGVWDATGKNIAVSGASRVRINAKTGALVGWE